MRTNQPGGIRVVGLTQSRERVFVDVLPHGAHPSTVLAIHGWAVESPWGAEVLDDGALELSYGVSELSGIPLVEEDVPRDEGLSPDEAGDPFQRVAAYAVVTSGRGVLLTQYNDQTHVEGLWGLPGGGLEPGESPAAGLHREVWEESGQRVELGGLLEIQSDHWIGRAPNGVVEDFHAVRIVYRATCSRPDDIVIHDVGGTTGDARWVPLDRLGDYPLSRPWRHLPELLRDRP